jgi:hypothetical protein
MALTGRCGGQEKGEENGSHQHHQKSNLIRKSPA